ncbi:MAG: DUF3108 domain-containing protein [Massilia sp.]|nr:DUF3108 domain-containing protein [Massilia sp.]
MMFFSFLSRQRRALAICAAAVLLHVWGLWWVLPQLGKASASAAAQQKAPIEARLLSVAAPFDPVPLARAEPIKPVRPVALAKRRPQRPAAPVVVQASAAAPSGESAAPAPAEDSAGASLSEADVVQPSEAGAPVPVLSDAEPAAAPVAPMPVEPVTVPPASARRYKVNVPPSAQIVLDVERRDADGLLWHGEAAMAWTLLGERYTMKVSAGIRLLIARVNLLVLESEGTTGESGFAPTLMTEQRRGRALTATHFNARDKLITFSASTASFALLPGAQDKATVPLQLAAIARGDSTQLDGGIEILVGEDKDASVYRFVVLGQDLLDTGLGKVATWHLSRPPRAGAYSARLDIWLAPSHGWYPVQIRNIEANGAVTTQTVKQIVMTEAGT